MYSLYYFFIDPKSGVTREQVEQTLNKATDWFRYDSKSWIVYTRGTAKSWYAALEKLVEPGGRLLIVKVDKSDYWGFMPNNLWEWLAKSR